MQGGGRHVDSRGGSRNGGGRHTRSCGCGASHARSRPPLWICNRDLCHGVHASNLRKSAMNVWCKYYCNNVLLQSVIARQQCYEYPFPMVASAICWSNEVTSHRKQQYHLCNCSFNCTSAPFRRNWARLSVLSWVQQRLRTPLIKDPPLRSGTGTGSVSKISKQCDKCKSMNWFQISSNFVETGYCSSGWEWWAALPFSEQEPILGSLASAVCHLGSFLWFY